MYGLKHAIMQLTCIHAETILKILNQEIVIHYL